MQSFVSVVLFTTLFSSADAFWRLSCSIANMGRIDPILSPNNVSSHVHMLSGGINISPTSTQASLMTSNCTTCEIQADKSAYWTPQLYFAFTNGSFTPVSNGGTVVYYLGRGDNASSIVPFPANFKMISGDATARTYDNTTLTYLNTRPIADRTSFACIDYNHPSPETTSMNNTNCPDGLRAQIQFQSCWDGVNAYLPDSAHVAYMSQIDNGVCPPTHPVPIPHLFFEVYYSVDAFNGMDGKFVFANGDETGYSFHGDFMSGWDADVLKAGITGCLTGDDNASGVTKDCAAFAPSIDEKFADDCVAAAPIFDEEVDGLLTSLPGCNPVSDGADGLKSVWCKVGGNGTVANANVAMGWKASISALPVAATAAVPDPFTTNDGSAMTMTADDSAATTAAPSFTATVSDADADASFGTAAPSEIASSTADDSDDDESATTAPAAASSTADVFAQLASALPAASSAAAATTTDNGSSAATDAADATNAADATSFIDPSAACSMYSGLSVAGCASAVAPATTEYAATTTVMADGSAADMSVITTLVTLTISV